MQDLWRRLETFNFLGFTLMFCPLLRSCASSGAETQPGASFILAFRVLPLVLVVSVLAPYFARMERGEIFALMTCGMAGVAGTVMVLYASVLNPVIHGALGNILIASVISTPAALAVAGIIVPFRPHQTPETRLILHDPP